MFYEYHQNNSGGSFDFDADRGISQYVIVEAKDAESADSRAMGIGLYFDGCDVGMDCDCCGDRWSRAWGEGSEYPEVYGTPVPEYTTMMPWMGDNPDIFIHRVDGTVEAVVSNR